MLKRVSSISLSIIYIFFSIGIGMSSHDCMGVTSDTSFFSYHNDGCACENYNSEENHDCCSDELDLVNLEDDQNFISSSVNISPSYVLLFALDLVQKIDKYIRTSINEASYFSDPPPILTPLYKLNCTYIVYG